MSETPRNQTPRPARAPVDAHAASNGPVPAPPSKAAAVVGLILVAVLVAGLLVDVANFSERYIFIPPRPHGDDSVALADTITRNRVLSYLVGMAAREAAGEKRLKLMLVPEDLGTLSNAEPDDFMGVPQDPLARRLIQPLVRGRLRTAAYDTVLPAETIARFEDEGRLVELPRGVYAVSVEGGTERVVLFSDASKQRLFVVPQELVP